MTRLGRPNSKFHLWKTTGGQITASTFRITPAYGADLACGSLPKPAFRFAEPPPFYYWWRAPSISSALALMPVGGSYQVGLAYALQIDLRSATSCAFDIDLGTSLTRPLQLIFRQRETNSRFPARRSVCARRLHFPFSISYLLLFLECATVPSRPGTPLTDNGPKIAARPRTKLAGARIGCP